MTGVQFVKAGRRFGRHLALHNLDLDCPRGVLTCLVGPNGAGKSTALALAAGLLAPTTGAVVNGGRPVRLSGPLEDTGYLPQRSAFHPSFTVSEVLDFTVAARGNSNLVRCQALTVTGLDSVLDRSVGELSGGWIRRLGLLSALLGSPAVLLLDEPFVGLDPETHDRLLAHLASRLQSGATILMASHEFEAADPLHPKVAVLEEGRLLLTAQVSGDTPNGNSSSRSFYRRALQKGSIPTQQEKE